MEKLTIQDNLLLNSRFSDVEVDKDSMQQSPTEAQKWWASILIGLIFFILASSAFLQSLNWISINVSGPRMWRSESGGSTFWGLFVSTVIFIMIIRYLLW